MKMLAKSSWVATVGLTLALASPLVSADTLYLTQPGDINYGTVDYSLSGQTATFTFLSNTAGGYLFIDSRIADLNINSTSFSVGTITAIEYPGFEPAGPALTNTFSGAGNVSSFGTFNLTTTQSDGFANATYSITFAVTNTSLTPWTSTSDVLIANTDGFLAAAHIAPCGLDPTANCSNLTMFVGDGPQFPGSSTVLEPNSASLAFLALGLLGAGFWTRRKT